MPTLSLVIPDLYPARPSAQTIAALPRLPMLERWLARARREPMPGDWRRWLLARHAPRWRAAGLAGPLAHALGAHEPAHWLATPVHYVAGLDTIRLHPAGLLSFDADEQGALVADFARVFAGSGWALRSAGRRELLLSGPPAPARTDDPARWLGVEPSEGLPSGGQSGPLRRVGAELEMWLHQHPVNEAREARGQLPATALWLWGGGEGAPPRAAAPQGAPAAGLSLRLAGADAFLDGLGAATGAGAPVAAGDAAGASLEPDAGGDAIVVLGGGELPDADRLARWEAGWFAPLLAHWQAGRWDGLTLACGDALWHARRGLAGALRAWRAPPPWWEQLLSC